MISQRHIRLFENEAEVKHLTIKNHQREWCSSFGFFRSGFDYWIDGMRAS